MYHLPFSRDAASVVSRFLWEKLNDLKVKVVLRSFQVGVNYGVCVIILSLFVRDLEKALCVFFLVVAVIAEKTRHRH